MPSSPTCPETASSPANVHSASDSPEAPPYSPITPVLQEAMLPPPLAHAPVVPPAFMDAPPASIPINESTNTDAIALRAALGVLQIQRLRSVKDIQTLQKRKEEALSDPTRFARGLAEGTIRAQPEPGVVGPSWTSAGGEDDSASESESGSEAEAEAEEDRMDDDAAPKAAPRFGEIPSAQNVVRCPPINWAKYHVVGDALDHVHEDQRLRPTGGTPQQDPRARPPVHQIAAPYSPWKDKLPETSMRTRSDARRG